MKRDLLSLRDFTGREIQAILDLTRRLKEDRQYGRDALAGRSIGLVFQKPSNRTRTSFDVGIYQLGGHGVYLAPQEINLGVRESSADVARTLSRYLDGLVARTNTHKDVVDLAANASIPVINGLCDLYHPCQALTDIFSIREKLGRLRGVKVAYVGDGNNVCHSLMLACAKSGVHLRVATPEGYAPCPEVVTLARQEADRHEGGLLVGNNPQEAVHGAEVVYADVWVSMGQEAERERRLRDFRGFQINEDLLAKADARCLFMHCLPAHRGEEVTAEVIDGERSMVFDQAENRLHTQKAVLMFLMRSATGASAEEKENIL